jgi:hypothetical protein
MNENKLLSMENFIEGARRLSSLYDSVGGRGPGLYIIAGPGNISDILQSRATVSRDFCLFYVYPKGENIDEREYSGLLDPSEGILFAASDENAPLKLRTALNILRIDDGFRVAFAGSVLRYFGEEGLDGILRSTATRALSNLRTEKRSALMHFRCSVHNIPEILSVKSVLPGKVPSGTKALVCGAGPSLEGQLEIIKANSSNMVIICAGHALKTLSKAGITPDFVVEMDSECYLNWRTKEKTDAVLVTFPLVSPEVPGNFSRIIWAEEPEGKFTAFLRRYGNRLIKLKISRSVIISALDFALLLGCEDVAMAGSDLCFTDSGRMYSGENRTVDSGELLKARGSNGGTVYTNWVFAGIKDALEGYIAGKIAENPELRIYNCTPGGIKINHALTVDLKGFVAGVDSTGFSRECLTAGPAGYVIPLDNINKEMTRLELLSNPFDASPGNYANLEQVLKFSLKHAVLASDEFPASAVEKKGLMKYLTVEFFNDIKSDFRRAGGVSSNSSPYIFDSFKKYALSFVKSSNPEYAGFLEELDRNDICDRRFELAPNQEYLPGLSFLSGGRKTVISDFLTVDSEPRAELSDFLKSENYSRYNTAVVFFAPGNWAHVVEFSRMYPGAEFMVLDPWPELFIQIIRRAMFVNFFPPGTFIAGIHPELRKWKRIFHSRRRKWLKEGRRVIFFTPEKIRGLPGISEAFDRLP